jgi:23S rRNA pseudouridine1911/1915/1917 synthase
MVVHPAHGNYTGTLVNALLYHCKNLSGINGEIRAGVVHRLDKDTSGLIVSAKDDVTHRVLSLQFSKKTTERTYYAIVWRKFKNKEGIIETLIGRSISDRKKMSVPQGGAGKLAITKYKVLKEFEFLSLIELKLETGRTHQIRVHLAHVQHPVFGDPTYSGRGNQLGSLPDKLRKKAALLLTMINRQALHAKTLGFVHPATKQKMLFDSELPDDIKNILEKLDND